MRAEIKTTPRDPYLLAIGSTNNALQNVKTFIIPFIFDSNSSLISKLLHWSYLNSVFIKSSAVIDIRLYHFMNYG